MPPRLPSDTEFNLTLTSVTATCGKDNFFDVYCACSDLVRISIGQYNRGDWLRALSAGLLHDATRPQSVLLDSRDPTVEICTFCSIDKRSAIFVTKTRKWVG